MVLSVSRDEWCCKTGTVVIKSHGDPNDLEVDRVAMVRPEKKVPRVVLDLIHHIIFALADQVPPFFWIADGPKIRPACCLATALKFSRL